LINVHWLKTYSNQKNKKGIHFMKNAIFHAAGSVRLIRFALRSAVIAAIFVAGGLFAQPVVKTLGGGTVSGYDGYKDGVTLQALFHTPIGVAVDSEMDNLYVADRDNNAIRDVELDGSDTFTFATNFLNKPVGVALDSDENVYVLNRGGTSTVNTNGTVLEFDYYGFLIATNATHLTNAAGIALDQNDNIYVTERTNLLVRITPSNVVTVATVTMSNAMLQGIAVMPNGTLAVCDFGRNGVYNIDPTTSIVTTNAGFNGPGDGTGIDNRGVPNSQAQFLQPYGVAAAGDGSLIISDFGNDRVKVITSSGITTNLYGVSSNDWNKSYPGWEDGTVVVPDQPGGVAARCPAGVALSADGTTVYTTEDYFHLVRKVTGGAFKALPPPPPDAPIGLTAIVTTNEQTIEVVLTWDQSDSTTNYIVERSGSSGGPYSPLANVGTTNTFTDVNIIPGATYYYVVVAENSGGESTPSSEVSISTPVLPPTSPNIGWFDFELNVINGLSEFYSTLHTVTAGNPYIANNPLNIAVDPIDYSNGLSTLYITIPPYTNNTPPSTVINNGSTAPAYENGVPEGSSDVYSLPPLELSNGLVTVEAVNVNSLGEASSVSSASFLFEIGNPIITSPGNNAAAITLSDVTSNVVFYYTLDGSDPTNAPASQQVATTNGVATIALDGTTNILFQVRGLGYGPTVGYVISGAAEQFFSSSTFSPNTISWGFKSGECSSAFIGAAGQTFYAPVTLTMLPGAKLYSMQFNMTVSSTGVGITDGGPVTDIFSFNSFLEEPIPGTTPTVYEQIPPYMFAGYADGVSPSDLVTFNGSNDFVSLVISNGNELAVGWLERYTQTNLYNTLSQTLITYSQAHDDLFPNPAQPNGVIVGGYGFQIPTNAVNGEQYQIQLSGASGTSDGIGAPGSSVPLFSGTLTNAAALGAGSLNGIKNVVVGSIPYLVGNAYPFGWFNAGDFGNSNLQNADLEQVFESAVYGFNTPPSSSDFFDAMDSCGRIGILDNNSGDEFYGFYTNAGALTSTERYDMYSGNNTYVDQMAFGDGQLDVSDVYLTFLRSEFTNDFVWFQRFWTNGVRVASATYAPGIIPAVKSRVAAKVLSPASYPAPSSITNTPYINFTTTDFIASPGTNITIPINATVFGPFPVRMMMINISIVPLDSSPAVTTPVQFTPNPAFGTALGSSTPAESMSEGNGNYSAVWLPANLEAPTQSPGLSNTFNIGTLTVNIPANATGASAYAIHFDHASASPSGLLSLPKRTFTGLITLSSRTNSYYGDGIPDSWRLRYFGTVYNELSVSNADADGTGMDNYQKYLAGLNPLDPTSILNEGTDQTVAQSQQDLVLYWPSVSGQTYLIQRSPTLFPPQWTTISTNVGDGTYMEIHDTSGGNNRFYQVTTP
jgi:hypothetical protein